MRSAELLDIPRIAAGAHMFTCGGFAHTKETTALKIGAVELWVNERKTVDFSLWAGIGAIVVGGWLLVLGGKR